MDGHGSHDQEDAKARAQLRKWESHPGNEVPLPSPVNVGHLANETIRKHPEAERDKGPNLGADHYIGIDMVRNSGNIDPHIKYDPIGFPETTRPHQGGASQQGGRDPLNFESRTGFMPTPSRPDQLRGPDGIIDQLHDDDINNQILMGHLPMHRGMPSPVPRDAPANDIRGFNPNPQNPFFR